MASPRVGLTSLSAELFIQIVSYLDAPDLIAVRQTNRQISAAALGAFADRFFGATETDLTRGSLARLRAVAGCERLRHRVRSLRISPWSPDREEDDDPPARQHDWSRGADGRLDLATPTALSLLGCVRNGLPNCRSFALDDRNLGRLRFEHPERWLQPTDAVAIVLALAAAADGPPLVRSLSVSFRLSAVAGALLPPAADLRRAAERLAAGLRALKIKLSDEGDDALALARALTLSARRLDAVAFGGSAAVIRCCIEGLCGQGGEQEQQEGGAAEERQQQQQQPPCLSIRHLAVGTAMAPRGLRQVAFHAERVRLLDGADVPADLLERLLLRLDGPRLLSLSFKNAYLRPAAAAQSEGGGGQSLWVPVLSAVRARFPNLDAFTLLSCGDYRFARRRRLWLCPAVRELTARLPRGSLHQRCIGGLVVADDGHGGTMQFRSIYNYWGKVPRAGRADDDDDDDDGWQVRKTRSHDWGVRYERRTAEGMAHVLEAIVCGMYSTETEVPDVTRCMGRDNGDAMTMRNSCQGWHWFQPSRYKIIQQGGDSFVRCP